MTLLLLQSALAQVAISSSIRANVACLKYGLRADGRKDHHDVIIVDKCENKTEPWLQTVKAALVQQKNVILPRSSRLCDSDMLH